MTALPLQRPPRPALRSGFTLVELMVVILIISLMFGIVMASFSGNDESQGVDSAVSRLTGAFNLAQTTALTRSQKTRVLIHADPDVREKFLRQILILVETEPDVWEVYADGQTLPSGVYYSPALSSAPTDVAPKLKTWRVGIDDRSFEVSANPPAPQPANDYSLSNEGGLTVDALSHSLTADTWYIYEFNPNGTAADSGARVAVVPAILQATEKLLIRHPEAGDGFVLFRAGKAMQFQVPAHLLEGN